MRFFRRNSWSKTRSRPFSSSKQCSTSTLGSVSSTIRNRNAFMHFLSAYRKDHNISNQPVWCLVMRAADRWNKMPLHEKFPYIEAARNTGYIYTSRDRRLNRVMRHLRQALHSEYNVDVFHLSKAVKQVQLWKRRLIDEILCI